VRNLIPNQVLLQGGISKLAGISCPITMGEFTITMEMRTITIGMYTITMGMYIYHHYGNVHLVNYLIVV